MRKWKDVKRKETMREMRNTIHEPIMKFLFTGQMRKHYLLGTLHSGTGRPRRQSTRLPAHRVVVYNFT
jgi:hypothetical protein